MNKIRENSNCQRYRKYQVHKQTRIYNEVLFVFDNINNTFNSKVTVSQKYTPKFYV